MPRNLKYHWVIWSVLVILVSIGFLAAYLSSSGILVALPLIPVASVHVSVFRLFPDKLRFSLQFNIAGHPDKRPFERPRPELGIYGSDNPGEPITILVQSAEKEAAFQALPASGYGQTTIVRELRPIASNDTPLVHWRPDYNALRQNLPPGITDLKFSVVEVGKQISGENVTLVIEPPLQLKSCVPGYCFLWVFMFWPIFASLFAIYGAILLIKTVKASPSRD